MINISTDEEMDRLMSLRASSKVPLPPEICLVDARDARPYFKWISYYETFGLSEHPMVEHMGKRRIDSAMASAVSRASHLDRILHYEAWVGRPSVVIEDLTTGGTEE
ncbi:MAG TPA: hypothetical protein VJY42_05035 [Candidatus Methanomethylophilaceae archaeon]|nr:hypothetical protein [Candidatus Methanomethylophilaceae archaeon]